MSKFVFLVIFPYDSVCFFNVKTNIMYNSKKNSYLFFLWIAIFTILKILLFCKFAKYILWLSFQGPIYLNILTFISSFLFPSKWSFHIYAFQLINSTFKTVYISYLFFNFNDYIYFTFRRHGWLFYKIPCSFYIDTSASWFNFLQKYI